jgi:7,8-dihydropterin-6-yl-methyl-4-(beta-D-ribofuranosyl)aminobenzene 5'-phosphate synthase
LSFRIHPLWWPLLVVSSPVLTPMLLLRNHRFKNNRERASQLNSERIGKAQPLELPELEYLNLTVLSEWMAEKGFLGEPGVSYLFRTDRGTLLYDIGYGISRSTLVHNATRLNISFDAVDALAISHLHLDHMGGIKAQRNRRVTIPTELGEPRGKPCFLPDQAKADGFQAQIIRGPQMLAAGIASSGPLARSLFFFGWTEEQALIARIKNKGLVVFCGCGHPTVEVILKMVQSLSNAPIYAIGGGLHFPLTGGRGKYPGIQPQVIFGADKPPWQRLTDNDLSNVINNINTVGPEKVFLSAHDTCDYGLKRFESELRAEAIVLKAGATYQL